MKAILPFFLLISGTAMAQLRWQNMDSSFQPLPPSVHVYRSSDSLDGKPNIAWYVIADLADRKLDFTTDTSMGRRLTPSQFHSRNGHPVVVVNTTFFSFETNRNLNIVIRDRKILSYNINRIHVKQKDSSLKPVEVYHGAIGISRRRKADVAWIRSDSGDRFAWASQVALPNGMGNLFTVDRNTGKSKNVSEPAPLSFVFRKWKMETAVGGGPVLVQAGEIKITNNEERKFGGKAINDKHPRTAMGYTGDGKLIILAVQGRFPGVAEGASLIHLATILKDLGCVEALNLDGGGSSCLLVNGKETIRPSDKTGQRPVPAVFIIR